MPDTSLVIKLRLEDSYSAAMKKVSDITKAFSKDAEGLESRLVALSRQKAPLTTALREANKELKQAQTQFDETGDSVAGLQAEMAQVKVDSLRRNLNLVTKAAKETEDQLKKTIQETGNLGEAGGSALRSKLETGVKSFITSGGGRLLSAFAMNAANTAAGSALGDTGGSIFASMLSTAVQGASIGTMVGGLGLGTAIGAAGGALLGAVSGKISALQSQDTAFQSYVQSAVEGQLSEMDSTLTGGSATAGQREQDMIAFARRFGSEEEAQAYLEQVKAMAVKTNYSYDDITGYSKSLLNTYSAEETLQVLRTLSDATAGLNLDSSGVGMFINGLSRMRTTGKVTQEYLNYFSERGAGRV